MELAVPRRNLLHRAFLQDFAVRGNELKAQAGDHILQLDHSPEISLSKATDCTESEIK